MPSLQTGQGIELDAGPSTLADWAGKMLEPACLFVPWQE